MKEISITGRGLTTMCRLCLSRGETMLDVFRFSTRFEDKVVDMIMKCAPVQVLRYDEMPKFVCRKCLTKLEEMRQFQMQIIQSDKTLRRYLQQLHASDNERRIESSIQRSNDSSIVNTDADIKYDSTVLHDVFNLNVNWREKECENFSSESKNNDKMSLKYEIKVEQIDKNTITLPDCADDPLDIWSKGDEFTDINIGERKMETTLTINSTCKNIEIKPEIKKEPIDDELIMNTENVSSNNYSDSEINNDNMKIDIDLISENYSCEICNKCFINSDDLKNHMCTVTGEKLIQCEICNRFISGYENFIKHKRIHTDAKPYQCDMCDKCFAHKYQLKEHKRTHTGEKPYKCNVCNKCFAHADGLKKHTRVHTGEKPYKCDMCIKSFSQSNHLKRHKRTHSGEKPYRCDVCGKCFTQPGNLVSHKRKHTGDQNYQCHICNKSFIESNSVKRHMRLHTGEKPYQCDQCDQCFTQASDLSKHKLSHVGEEPNKYLDINVGESKAEAPANFESETKSIEEIYLKSEIKNSSIYNNESIIQTESTVDTQNTTFNDCGSEINNGDLHIDLHGTSGNSACVRSTDVENIIENCEDKEISVTLSQSVGKRRHSCKICDKYFANSNDLQSHVCSDTGEKPFQCDICNNFFAVYEHLINHKRIHTDDEPYKPYKCNLCNKCFLWPSHLNKHKRTHTGEKPYQCDICNKCFARADGLYKHKRVHTGEKPHKCDICNKSFALSGCLKKHKRIHTGEKPYRCDICNKCFAIADTLKKHKRVHTREKPYRCDICNRCFAIAETLKTHKRVHTREKPYQCDICMKCFTRSYQLRKHKLSHTGENPNEYSSINVSESKAETPAIFKLETKSIEDIYLKSEIKDTPIYDNESFIQTEFIADTQNTTFNDCGSEINNDDIYIDLHHTSGNSACVRSTDVENIIENCEDKEISVTLSQSVGKRRHSCKICDKYFANSNDLKSHVCIDTGEKSFQCDICMTCFAHSYQLRKHKLSHTGEKPNECSAINVGESKAEAPAIFKLETKSIEEIYLKSEIKDTPIYDNESFIQTEFIADTQNTTFNDCGSEINNDDIYIDLHHTSGNSACARSTDVQNIIENCEDKEISVTLSQSVGTRRHSEDKLYPCKMCSKCFVNSDCLKKHVCTVTGEILIQCEICNRFFSGYENLIKHKRVHTDAKPYQCDICDKCFAQKAHLIVHKRTHTGEKPHQCNICNKCFALADTLKKHIRVHTGEKPYQCDICKKCFAFADSWKKHKRVHTGEKPHQCDICMKCFAEISHLKSHKRTHSGEKPYRCNVCGKCFTQPGNLVIHKRRHTGDRRYQCHICNKSFIESYSLKLHMRLHTGEKPHQCDVCDKCFTHAVSLSRHKLSHAGEEPNEYSDIDVGETKVEAPVNFEPETKSIDETNLKVEIKDTAIFDN